MTVIRICIAGVTGWVGRALVPAVIDAPDLELVGAVSRSARGGRLGDVLGLTAPARAAGDVVVAGTVAEALEAARSADVLIDYTAPDAVKANVLEAISAKVHAVIGTSGLTDADHDELDAAARRQRVGVLAAGNFAISAILLQHFAVIAAAHMPSWEIVDYASADKVDAPSGTARELANRLAGVGSPEVAVPVERTQGSPEARGLTLNGTQVHSIRLPGHVIGVEALFGKPSERLSIRYDAGSGAEPYVAGTLLATRRVGTVVGVQRGLDRLLGLGS
jgi:4-hydroxy-tetrahydrodipicolinate reductase